MSLKTMFLPFAAVFFCLCRTSFGVGNGPSDDRVLVKEGSDAVLPCSLKNQNLNKALFDWKKEDRNSRKEVFLYVAGEHYNNDKRTGQDQQFKGRVSHFEDELQHGNASIKIQNTKVEDSGIYTCYFPGLDPPQIFYVELVVDGILKDRSGSPGVTPAPDIRTVNATDEGTLLQCDVRGASPKPTVEWKNSDVKVLHTQEPQVTESKGRYDVSLLITVKQTGLYRCVVTQEELHHQIHAETYVYISVSENPWWSWLIHGLVIGVVITAAVALRIWPVLRKLCRCGGSADSKAASNVDEEAVRLSTKSSADSGPGSSHYDSDSEVDDDAYLLSAKGSSDVTIFVKEDSVVILPYFPGSQNLTCKVFIWKKGDQNVFLYAAGKIENEGHCGQHQQFKGRVSHFGGELQHGNASIKIHNTKVKDSGIYTCHFPGLDPPLTFYVELVVGGLKWTTSQFHNF